MKQKNESDGKCKYARCRDDESVIYYGIGLCGFHMNQIFNEPRFEKMNGDKIIAVLIKAKKLIAKRRMKTMKRTTKSNICSKVNTGSITKL